MPRYAAHIAQCWWCPPRKAKPRGRAGYVMGFLEVEVCRDEGSCFYPALGRGQMRTFLFALSGVILSLCFQGASQIHLGLSLGLRHGVVAFEMDHGRFGDESGCGILDVLNE